ISNIENSGFKNDEEYIPYISSLCSKIGFLLTNWQMKIMTDFVKNWDMSNAKSEILYSLFQELYMFLSFMKFIQNFSDLSNTELYIKNLKIEIKNLKWDQIWKELINFLENYKMQYTLFYTNALKNYPNKSGVINSMVTLLD